MRKENIMKINIKTNIDSFSLSFKEKLRSINKEEALNAVGYDMETEMRKRFDTETDYQGNKWERLKYRNGKPLTKGGYLKGSLEIAKISGNTVSVFSNKKYARLQDQGGTVVPKDKKALAFPINGKIFLAKKIVVPARKFSGISDENKKKFEKTVEEYIINKLK